MYYRSTWPPVFESLVNIPYAKLTDKVLYFVLLLLNFILLLLIRITKYLPDIQYPGMVIKSHIQTSNMETVILGEQLKKADKITAAILFKGTAALAGHIQANTHTRIAVI